MLKYFVFLAFLIYAPLSFATAYERGRILCDDFEDTENLYKTSPSVSGYAVDYARCLLARNTENDVKALNMLEVEASKNEVGAAYWLALYTATGGSMKIATDWDSNSYNEALQAFGRVIHLINQKVNYPEGWADPEYPDQYELKAYHYLVFFSYLKFKDGLDGSDNSYLFQSASYTEDKKKLKFYPQYSPYTLHSLDQVIENAKICARLPQKAHFDKLLYHKVTRHCHMMEDHAKRIRPLEKERLALLEDESCARDIEACSKYREVLLNKIFPLMENSGEEEKKIFGMTLDSLKTD